MLFQLNVVLVLGIKTGWENLLLVPERCRVTTCNV